MRFEESELRNGILYENEFRDELRKSIDESIIERLRGII